MSEFGGTKHPDTSKKTRRAGFKDVRNKAKQQMVQELMEAHQRLSTLEKIKKLDRKLGVGVGAIKERTRLIKLLEQENQK